MSGLCEGRVCVITGAGRGIGRAHAEALARAGAKVVVNDLGALRDGTPGPSETAQEAVAGIVSAGGEAEADGSDVSTKAGAQSVIQRALDTWGRIDVLINNAGILRDRMLVNMTEDDWDDVIRVHLKSTYLTSTIVARHWRELSKGGADVDARIVNTTSASGIYGQPGQSNYGAAKAGIAAFSVIAAMELERYGVTVNALCPTALTRMTEDIPLASSPEASDGGLDPVWVSPLVVWLASPQSRGVTGRVLVASGRNIAVAEGWRRGPSAPPVSDPAEVDAVIRPLLAAARPNADMRGDVPTD